jgi:hypothetical protein
MVAESPGRCTAGFAKRIFNHGGLLVMLGRLLNSLRVRERRQHVRITYLRLVLHIDGRRFETVDWSLGGFWITGFRGRSHKGAVLSGTIEHPDAAGGEFVAEVVAADNGDVRARFMEITPAVFVAMGGLRQL